MCENNIKSVIKELDLLDPNSQIYALSDKTVFVACQYGVVITKPNLKQSLIFLLGEES